jgi:hypothetical protein
MSRLLRVVGAVMPDLVARLEIVTKLETLEDVLHWGGDIADVIVQDEYTHDVVLRHPAFLVFDTT